MHKPDIIRQSERSESGDKNVARMHDDGSAQNVRGGTRGRLFQEGVFEAEEIEDTVQADGGDGLLGRLFYFGFGMESNA